MLERTIETAFVRAVKTAGGLAYKFTSPAQRSVPDRLIVLRGQTFFVEFKAPGRKPTPAQAREHKRIRDAGGVVYVIDHTSQIEMVLDVYK